MKLDEIAWAADRPIETIAFTPHSVFSPDWLVLRRIAGPGLSSPAGPGLARMVRKIIMSFAEEPISEAISGHRPNGAPSAHSHLAVVPLPFVADTQADGRLLGLGLVLPREACELDQSALFRAIRRWEDASRRANEETPMLPVHLGATGTLVVVRVAEPAEHLALQARTWCRPARRWASATPIALGRNPGDLRSRDPDKLDRAVGKAEDCIRDSCAHIGLPRPAAVTVLPCVPLPGAAKAWHYPPYPGTSGARVQRVLTHAAIEFSGPVAGPILLGAGRYVGLGLMRPVDDDE